MIEEMQGFRLSPQQKHLWHLQESDNFPYSSKCAVLIEGNLDIDTLRIALELVVSRHEILRTNFHCLPGMTIPLQVIRNNGIAWDENHNLKGCTPQEQEEFLSALFDQVNKQQFDLVQGSPLHLSLVTLSSSKYALLIRLPALCADAATLKILVQEISQSYAACLQGKELDDEPLQYADLAEWQNELLEGAETEVGRDYWRKQDFSALTKLKLPFEKQSTQQLEFQPRTQSFTISSALLEQIYTLTQQYNISVAEFFLASWQILLMRLTKQENLSIGVAYEGRKYQELEKSVGLFTKYLPLISNIELESNSIDVFHKNNECADNIYKLQDYFSWKLIAELDPNTLGFFPVCFEFQELPKNYVAADVYFSIDQLYSCIERFKVKLSCIRQNDTLNVAFHYESNLFNVEDIKRLVGQFQTLLASALAHPETAISHLDILSQIERQQLLDQVNTKGDYPHNKCIHQLFEEQVGKTPNKVAVIFEDQELTYHDLNQRANKIAHYLQKQGVTPEVLVGLCVERSLDMIVGLLAILKAGGAYVPLDPALPKEGLALRLQNAQVSLIISHSSLVNNFEPMTNNKEQTTVIYLDSDWETITQENDVNPNSKVTSENLVYVLFTSGSTGTAKGVAIEHRQLLNYLYAIIEQLKLPAGANFALVSTFAADLGNTAIFPCLCTGGCLHIISYERATDPAALAEYCRRHPIDCLKIVPSHLASLLTSSSPESILPRERLILGGEATSWELIEQIQKYAQYCLIFNHYGPTEATVGVLTYPVELNDDFSCYPKSQTVPLGRSIPNTQVYVLEENLQPAPIGLKGEIYIGGTTLARCYLNQPEQTAVKFIPNPFSQEEGARLYKTGDRARYLPDGTIEFLGRTDHQVKIRGFRIELGEIEAVLSLHPNVQEVVVLARDSESSQKYLAAYVVPSQESPILNNELRNYMQARLPEYMVPSTFVMLKALPLTPNGKVDRQALPEPNSVRPELEKSFATPRTPVEEVLTGIWARVLGTEYLGIHDNFFDLGGHSLLATQVVSQVREAFQVELRLRSLFETPTVAELAKLIESTIRAGQKLQLPPIEGVSRDRQLPLSFAQQRLWFLAQLEPGNPFYNISRSVRLKGLLNVAALEQSLNEIVRRHEVLRTSFTDVDGRPVQEIASALNITLPIINLGELSEEEREAEVRRLASSQGRQSFDLTQDALLRTTLLRLQEEEHVLVFTIHHIVADGWSTGVIIHEITALYKSFHSGKPSSLPELPVQYADFAIWQRQWLQTVQSSQMAYWKQQLGGNLPVLQLPTDRPRPAIQSFRGRKQPWQISKTLTEALKSLSQREAVTPFMTMLAAFKTLLYRYTNQADILIGSPIANRNRQEIERLIGFFVNTLVLRTDLSGNPSFKELLQRVRQVTLDAYTHQDLPFEQLVEELQPERNLSYTPLFQVGFAFLNAPMEELKLPDLSLSAMEVEPETSLFDLTVYLTETEQGMMGLFEYNSDLFDADTIERMQGHFQTLLSGIVANPKQHLSDLPILTATEQQQLLVDWNQTSADYPSICIHQLFEAQVEQTPDAVAVVFEDQQLTYQELNARANQLAHYLGSLGVGPEVLVGICVERSLEMVIGLLGILKAGGAYVPLDPAYPQERLAYMLSDAQVSLLLTQEKLIPRFTGSGVRLICLDTGWQVISQENVDNPVSGVQPENLAYVIYTSGSTGKPKGTAIAHKGVVNYLSWCTRAYAVAEGCGAPVHSSIGFDATITSLFSPLLVGQKVLLLPEKEEIAALAATLSSQNYSSLVKITPAHLDILSQLLTSKKAPGETRALIIGGEALSGKSLSFWRTYAPDTRLINEYGPTETVVGCCVYEVTEETSLSGAVPIGRPIANIQLYILDRFLQPVPIGVLGELYIGGTGVARGYLNRPELTAVKFIPNSFSDQPNARLYKTGDLARYLPNGEIEYIGRIDNQVKIRGFRIELGEIEAVLASHPAVEQTVVLDQEDKYGDQRLVAYVIASPQYQPSEKQVSETAWQNENISEWEVVFDQSYDQISQHQDPTFNITGWNSSYTNLPMPTAEMREWVDHTVERILTLQPSRVLEIGCGTGLLLFRVAPHCTQYWGTDISSVVLNQLQQQLIIQEQKLPQVKLFQKKAEDFENVEAKAFDIVILNSVIQYFPSITYLLQVLEGAVRTVEPGGFIFVGDVRNLPLLDAFHASVQLHQASVSLSRSQLQQRVQKSIAQESELVIDPTFFIALKQHLPQITHVQIQPKGGDYHNELTKFRYDVILHVGSEVDYPQDFPWLDWEEQQLTLTSVRQLLQSTKPEILGLRRVPNARLLAEVKTLELLANDSQCETVGDIRQALQSIDTRFGVNPEDLWALNQELPYAIDISWASAIADGSYDVILTRCSTARSAEFKEIVPSFPGEAVRPKPWNFYANSPLKAKLTRDLVPQLRRFLQEKLPEYMVPSAFVTLEALPLTPNGKVDRRSLVASASALTQVESEEIFVAPSTPVEEILAGIWADVLDLDQVGIHDNFFELGGHSLLATRVISQIQKVFEVKLPLHRLFDKPTVAKLATEIEKAGRADSGLEATTIERISRSHELPLSFAQQRLWFLHQLEPNSPFYNIAAAIRLQGELNLRALQQSFKEILRRHEALRTNFQTIEGQPVAIISSVTLLPLPIFDISELPSNQQQVEVRKLADKEAQQLFDFNSDLLLRVRLLRLSEQEHIMLLTMHHIASDGWSIGVLVREVKALYQAFCSGQPSPLPELPIQYADFAVWQRQQLQGEVLEAQLAYWKKQLGSNLPVLQLPTIRPRTEVKTNRGATQSFLIPSNISQELQALSRQQGVTLFMTLLAGFQILLQRYTSQDDIVVGTDVANRNQAEIESLIGFFINLLVLRTDLSGNPSFEELLKRVRSVTLGAYAHQDLPFDQLVKALQPERNLSNTPPLFQVLFVLQNAPMPPLELPGLTLSLLEVENKIARFDLALFITETEQGILGKWQYNSDIFDATTITRMTDNFQTLLNSIVSQPDARIGNLEMLTDDERKQQTTQKIERKAFKREKFIRVAPKAVNLSQERLIKTTYLQPGQTFPLVIQPDADEIDLVAWAKTNQKFLETELLKHGAILFRDFNVDSVSEFESVAQAICPNLFGEYGDLPRAGESGKVYGSTPYPPDTAILFHNESSHLHQFPLKIWFFCIQPSTQGGETPIVDCRKAYKLLNSKLQELLAEKQFMYVRNYTNGLDVSWQNFFRTNDKSLVENYCRQAKIDFEWYDNNSLVTRQVRPVVAVHPKTGDKIFFNQIQLHHIAYLDTEVRESLLSLFGDKKLPRNVYYGDGTPIEDEVIAEINEVYQHSKTSFPWQKGDILMLDNMLAAHGRYPYEGERKIVVAMGEMIQSQDIKLHSRQGGDK